MPSNLQDMFLNQVRQEAQMLNVYLVNGVHLQGKLIGFDNFIVILEVEGKHELIYKHAISTLMPINQFRLKQEMPTKKNSLQEKHQERNKKEENIEVSTK